MLNVNNSIDSMQQLNGQMGLNGDAANLRTQGQINGMSFQLDQDPVAAVQDAAEEATFGVDNSKKQKLAARRQKQNVSVLTVEKAMAFAELVAKFHNADFEARKRITDNYRSSRVRDHHRLLTDLRNLGGQPASNYAHLMKAAQEETNPEFKQFLRESADMLYREKSSEIQAALNAIEVATASDLGDSVKLSESYAEISNNCNEPEKMIEYIEKQFGPDRVDEGIEFMLKSLGADMSSQVSSNEQVVLEFVGKNLSYARSLNSGKSIVGNFVKRLSSAHGINVNISPAKILTGLLNISKQRFITPASIRDLYSSVSKQKPDTEVLIAQDFLTCCRNLGSELFDSDEVRLRVIQSVEQFVNGLVDAEDEWLEAGGN
jgi:type III secretion protein W